LRLALQLQTEFLEESDRSCEVVHNNADVVHPLEWHAAEYSRRQCQRIDVTRDQRSMVAEVGDGIEALQATRLEDCQQIGRPRAAVPPGDEQPILAAEGDRPLAPVLLFAECSHDRRQRLRRLGPSGIETQVRQRLGNLRARQTALQSAAQVHIELVVVAHRR